MSFSVAAAVGGSRGVPKGTEPKNYSARCSPPHANIQLKHTKRRLSIGSVQSLKRCVNGTHYYTDISQIVLLVLFYSFFNFLFYSFFNFPFYSFPNLFFIYDIPLFCFLV
ncbi:hypothetical protein FGF80_17920 (plasmid) [Natrinema pallidum]|uniref:Uncharacterized protein n=1 Tax=Natrinema pallidum TaxID=69527 RepID=A0A4P9TJC4_9EURY|nr:hypothetical protein FGF80_17920 [Natrinema pallidum]